MRLKKHENPRGGNQRNDKGRQNPKARRRINKRNKALLKQYSE